jgi:hypothetical protein
MPGEALRELLLNADEGLLGSDPISPLKSHLGIEFGADGHDLPRAQQRGIERNVRMAASWRVKFAASASSTVCSAIASSASVDTMPTPNRAVTPVIAVPGAAQRVASATTRSVTACVVLPLTRSSFIVRCPPSA